jgi:hypothetical protein
MTLINALVEYMTLLHLDKESIMPAKPFLQIRKAVKRNANFDSDEVREGVLHLLDSLEQDVTDVGDDDEAIEFSSTTEKYTAELREALATAEREADREGA